MDLDPVEAALPVGSLEGLEGAGTGLEAGEGAKRIRVLEPRSKRYPKSLQERSSEVAGAVSGSVSGRAETVEEWEEEYDPLDDDYLLADLTGIANVPGMEAKLLAGPAGSQESKGKPVPPWRASEQQTTFRGKIAVDEEGQDIPLSDCLQLLPIALQTALRSNGWRKDFLLQAAIDSYADVVDIVRQSFGPGKQESFYKSYSNELWIWYGEMGDRIRRDKSRRMNPAADIREQSRLGGGLKMGAEVDLTLTHLCHARPTVRRSRFSRALADLPSENQRESMKRMEREKWLDRLVQVLKESDVPVCRIADSTVDPTATLRLAFGSRRHRTLRSRYKVWCKIRLWLSCVHRTFWPAGPSQMLDYLQDCGSSMGKSWPGEVAAALSMMEKAGGFRPENCISEMAIWKGAVDSMNMELQSVQRWGLPAVRKAPQTPVLHIISLELEVIRESQSFYFRLFCFVRLLKIWGALRSDDVTGICPRRLMLTDRVLRGVLVETKTTGPGKKVKEVAFFIARQCKFLEGADWMECGMGLCSTEGMRFSRDFFLPQPNRNWTGTLPKLMSYSDMAGVSRQVSAFLKVPVYKDGNWERSQQDMLPRPAPLYWTEHSERHFLVSVAAALGEAKSAVDMIGRWGIDKAQSHDYIHTSRQVVTGIQRKVITALKFGSCPYDEDDLLQGLLDFLRSKGVEAEIAKEFAARSFAKITESDGLGMRRKVLDAFPDEEFGEEDQVKPSMDQEMEMQTGPQEDQQDEQALPADGQYWMTVSKSGFRCLHKGGTARCNVDPLRVHRWELCEPGSAKADKPCSFCFDKADLGSDDSSDSSEDVSSAEDP